MEQQGHHLLLMHGCAEWEHLMEKFVNYLAGASVALWGESNAELTTFPATFALNCYVFSVYFPARGRLRILF